MGKCTACSAASCAKEGDATLLSVVPALLHVPLRRCKPLWILERPISCFGQMVSEGDAGKMNLWPKLHAISRLRQVMRTCRRHFTDVPLDAFMLDASDALACRSVLSQSAAVTGS